MLTDLPLQEVTLKMRRNMFSPLEGPPSIAIFNENVSQKMDRKGWKNCVVPDLNPLEFFLGATLKSMSMNENVIMNQN